jgi:hypothetical protein
MAERTESGLVPISSEFCGHETSRDMGRRNKEWCGCKRGHLRKCGRGGRGGGGGSLPFQVHALLTAYGNYGGGNGDDDDGGRHRWRWGTATATVVVVGGGYWWSVAGVWIAGRDNNSS